MGGTACRRAVTGVGGTMRRSGSRCEGAAHSKSRGEASEARRSAGCCGGWTGQRCVHDPASHGPEAVPAWRAWSGAMARHQAAIGRRRNKVDVSEVNENKELVEKLREAAGHSRVMTISAATTQNVQELMGRLKKFVKRKVEGGKVEEADVLLAEVDL
ncbi:hypothetical protein ACHAWF_002845 [Thalassiosira exigua]